MNNHIANLAQKNIPNVHLRRVFIFFWLTDNIGKLPLICNTFCSDFCEKRFKTKKPLFHLLAKVTQKKMQNGKFGLK